MLRGSEPARLFAGTHTHQWGLCCAKCLFCWRYMFSRKGLAGDRLPPAHSVPKEKQRKSLALAQGRGIFPTQYFL